MAVDLQVGSARTMMAVEEASATGLRSMQHLIHHLSTSSSSSSCRQLTDFTVSNFNNFISILDHSRLGRARFRRAPVPAPLPPHPLTVFDFTKTNMPPPAITTSAVTNNNKPPLPLAADNNKCLHASDSTSGGNTFSVGSRGRCHCMSTSSSNSKRRKSRVKRTIKVPAISSKIADIPPDEYSWRKYGQKSIKGSPYPRGYYKCSTVRGCAARKHVERDPDDPSMLIVTYEADHRHTDSVPRPLPVATIVFNSSST